MAVLDSTRFFRLSYVFWTLLGINNNQTEWKKLYWTYGILINLFFPISFCCSLFIGLLQPQTFPEKLETLVVFISALSCCAQFLVYAFKMKDIKEVNHILRKLDERILRNEEINMFEEMSSDIQNMTHFFGWSYLAVGVMAILSGISNIIQAQRRLVYSAWLPFDWHNSTLAFCIAGLFQLLALFFCIAQNFADDSFPPISLSLLTGHLSCLELRISTIGHRSFDHPYRIVMLQLCIQDQLALYEYCKQIENIISMPLLILFTLTGLNTGLALAALLFVAEGFFNYMYYIVYSFAVLLRIFPVCYYGSQLQLKFQQLHRAVYFSNWVEEERAFKKDMIVFTERTLKMQTIYAGGLFRVHMDTFFSCCKAAYSMLAMFLKLKA